MSLRSKNKKLLKEDIENMAVEEQKLRRLTIKAFHMDTVVEGDRNDITTGG